MCSSHVLKPLLQVVIDTEFINCPHSITALYYDPFQWGEWTQSSWNSWGYKRSLRPEGEINQGRDGQTKMHIAFWWRQAGPWGDDLSVPKWGRDAGGLLSPFCSFITNPPEFHSLPAKWLVERSAPQMDLTHMQLAGKNHGRHSGSLPCLVNDPRKSYSSISLFMKDFWLKLLPSLFSHFLGVFWVRLG